MERVTLARMLPSRTDFGTLPARLRDCLQSSLGDHAADIKLDTATYTTYMEISCEFDLGGKKRTLKRSDVLEALGGGVADYIMTEEEEALIHRLIVREYGYEDEEDVGKIVAFYKQSRGAEDEAVSERKKKRAAIAREIVRMWRHDPDLNLDGVMRFRLQAYREELHDLAEYAVDEFLMDKQYQEFISLLKYFVFIQQAKTPAAHLMHKGGSEFLLLDEAMSPLDTEQLDGTFTVEMLDKEVNFEDLIVSTLITVAPRQIYIHTRDPEVQIVKTILQIFEDRARICCSCAHCRPLLGESGPKKEVVGAPEK